VAGDDEAERRDVAHPQMPPQAISVPTRFSAVMIAVSRRCREPAA